MNPAAARAGVRAATALIGMFASADAAALDAAEQAMPLTVRTRDEHASLIYQCGERYSYSELVRGKGGSFELRVARIEGCKPVAIFHTHPKGGADRGERFSADDVAMAEAAGLDSYIAVERDMTVRVLDRSVREITKGAQRMPGAEGRVIGTVRQ